MYVLEAGKATCRKYTSEKAKSTLHYISYALPVFLEKQLVRFSPAAAGTKPMKQGLN